METPLKSDLGAVFAAAIQGARSQQQDAVRIRWLEGEAAWLIVLADGMGGHAAGDLASKIAVDSFVGTFASLREENTGFEESFRGALEDANARIATVQSARPETRGMGTTLVAAHISGEGLRWVSVGDSLLLVYRDGAVAHLNEDHSLRSLEVGDRGGASANMLISALSGGPIQKIDLHAEPVAIESSDVLIVASDGVLSLTEEEIAGVLASAGEREVDAMTEALIEGVNRADKPNQDNCTIAIFSGNTDAAPPAATPAGGGRVLSVLLLLIAIAAAAFAAYRFYF